MRSSARKSLKTQEKTPHLQTPDIRPAAMDIAPSPPMVRCIEDSVILPQIQEDPPQQCSGEPRTLTPPAEILRQEIVLPIRYPVIFENDCLAPENSALAWAIAHQEPGRRHAVAVFCDSGFLESTPNFQRRLADYFEAHPDQLELRVDCVEVAGGERCKNDPSLVARLHRVLDEARLDRHSVALTFGGGSVLDAVGFVAATFHRGMRMLRAPTTVLSQNDAGVGVKNGVNALGKKNLLGTFAAPHAVLNDVQFLATLDVRDRRAGVAEAVKVALIRDPQFFYWLEEHAQRLARFELDSVAYMVKRTAQLHLEHITRGGDPFETGSSRPLDFGHWSAHKLEALTNYELRHGEAVAIGIAIDCMYAARQGELSEHDASRVLALLQSLGFDLFHPALLECQQGTNHLSLLAGLQEFREHLGGELTLTLLRGVGAPFEVHAMDEVLLAEIVGELHQNHQSRSES